MIDGGGIVTERALVAAMYAARTRLERARLRRAILARRTAPRWIARAVNGGWDSGAARGGAEY